MMKIEILGTGCAKCKRLLANVQDAVKDLGVEAEVIKVDSIDQIVERGVMSTPALYIDGKMRMAGKVPTVDDLKKLFQG